MLPPQALSVLQRFTDRADGLAAGALTGLYGVGSLALGDWDPASSNVDAVAVSDRPWDSGVVTALTPAVHRLGPSRRQAARIAFVTWNDLAADPATLDIPVLHGGTTVESGELANPLTWQILRISGICTRGPEYPEVGAGDLRAWAAERLATHWLQQLTWWRRHPIKLWFRHRTSSAVLEVARLSVLADSGRVVSKLEAGETRVDGARSSTQRILRDSIGYRQGSRVSMYWGPWERKRDTLSWVRSAISEKGTV